MNADSYLLLNSVLGDRPCIDPTLASPASTAPFAVQAIAQQCYYFLYLYSSAKAQLTDTTSAYNTLVQYMAVRQQIRNEEQLGRTVSQPPARLTWPLDLRPAQPVNNLELRLTIVGGGSVARALLRRLLRDSSNEISSSLSTAGGAASGTGSNGIDPVLAATLLFHPSRITVLTRQPQNLTEFAFKGVRCLTISHGKEALAHSDLVVLACQPQHLAELSKELFTATIAKASPAPSPAGAPSTAPAPQHEQPARLKDTAVVLSVLAATPKAKIAKSLHHNPQLILRTQLETPARLPTVAAAHHKASEDCAALQVRYMADRDSFLREAVEEAEAHAIAQLAEEMAATADSRLDASLPGAGAGATAARLPKELALRAAVRAATQATVATRFLPPPRPALLLEQAPPSTAFFSSAWLTLQQVVRALMVSMAAAAERRGGDRAGRQARDGAAQLAKANRRGVQGKYRKGPLGVAGGSKQVAHAPADGSSGEAQDNIEAPLVHLCASLAMLPEHGWRRVVVQTLHRYGAAPSTAELTAPYLEAASHSVTSLMSDGSNSGGAGGTRAPSAEAPSPAPTDPSAQENDPHGAQQGTLVPRAYKRGPEAFWKDTQQQFRAILTLK